MIPASAAVRPFLITIDTEGDNLWARPHAVTTRNAAFLLRFQQLCQRNGLRPTWLTNWEMAHEPAFVEFAADALRTKAAEIGMHLHAWNSPPIVPLTADDDLYMPYLIEYPPDVLREKVKRLTGALEDAFGVKMLSHRAGRWGFDEIYAQALIDQGYRVDCSVTPHYSWRFCKGDPSKHGGSDFTSFPEFPYFVDPKNIRQSGDSPLLELPMTFVRTRSWPEIVEQCRRIFSGNFYGAVLLNKTFPNHLKLMPNGRNIDAMLKIVQIARETNRPYLQVAIHSSELMPGGSPAFSTEDSIERLYDDLERLFESAVSAFTGATLAEYHDIYLRKGT